DFVGGADALHRHHVAEPLGAVGLAAAGVNFGIDQPGPDCSDANALAGDFMSEPDREGIDGTLGRRVIDIGFGRTEFCGNRGRVDETPPLAPRFPASPGHRMLPGTLTAIMRWMRSADTSSTRDVVPTMPALLTSAPSVPNLSAALNSARISLSLPTSHFTAIALPFFASMMETTWRAAASLLA